MRSSNSLSAGDLLASLGANVRLVGDPARSMTRAVSLNDATDGVLTFSRREGEALARDVARLSGVTLICLDDPVLATVDASRLTLLVTDNPRLTFIRSVEKFFAPPAPPAGVHATAVVDPSARIDPTASIGAFCVVGPDCSIGAGSVLYPHVTVYRGVRIAERVVVHAGTVIGADGFGYERNEEGELEKFPHIGGVVIESDVEIGSNTSIDRGTLGDTILRRGAKIDNQVHISHNVDVGRSAVVIAQSMIGGSVVLGDHSWIAPSACVMNQRRVGEQATVGLQALVVKDVAAEQTVMGSPAVDQREFQSQRARLRQLAEKD